MAIYMWRDVQIDYLCFTANAANSTVKLTKNGSPTAVTLETSTDGSTRTTYTIWDTITLNNIWDKVYWRNTSETTTGFSTAYNTYYKFAMTWSIAASGDITTLLNKNWTNTLSQWCFSNLFNGCSALTKAPELPATTLADGCYYYMFYNCTNLTTVPQLPATTVYTSCYQNMFYYCSSLAQLPKLPATTLTNSCYREMFSACSGIKLSTSKTWAYQTPYRIPTTWTWTTASYSLYYMFQSTWWTFTWTPSINTTYYTSNTVI